MTTVILGVPDEKTLKSYEQQLAQLNIHFYAWMEQPENYLTAIALKPYTKAELPEFLAALRLFK